MTLPMQRFTGAGHKTLVIAFLWNFDFFLYFLYFYLTQGHLNMNHIKFQPNWMKDVAYRRPTSFCTNFKETSEPQETILEGEFGLSKFV
jgi:hypothetical protein